MKRMTAGRFQAQCLRILDEVCRTKEPVIITSRGRAIAKLLPAGTFLGCLQGIVKTHGDIESPVEPIESWQVLR